MTTVELFTRAHSTGGNRNTVRAIFGFAVTAAKAAAEVVARWYRQRQDRAAFKTLLGKEEWVYRDLGIHRGDVEWASRLPMHLNAAQELDKVRKQSRGNW